MAEKEFTLDIRARQPKARSQRLRELGTSGSGGGSTVVQVTGGDGQPNEPDHHHDNLPVLDKLSLNDGYLMIDALVEGENDQGEPV